MSYPTCPHCGTQITEGEDYAPAVSVWGSDGGRVALWCSECDKDFWVEELVKRTFTSFKEET